MRLGHTFGLTSLSGKTGRDHTYSWVIVNELRAAKYEAFSRPHGESIVHIPPQVGIIMAAEGYNGIHVRFSKSTGEIFDSDCNVQLSTTIQLFNSDSLFQFPQRNRYFQRSTVIATFNWDSTSALQLSTAIQRSTVIPTFKCGLHSQLLAVAVTTVDF